MYQLVTFHFEIHLVDGFLQDCFVLFQLLIAISALQYFQLELLVVS